MGTVAPAASAVQKAMKSRHLVECVPNFSEGRSTETLRAIGDAIRSVEGVGLLDQSADVDHHRSVFTFAGEPEAVSEAAFRAAAVAVERIDLRSHSGVHPRMGAIDVIPFVPLGETTPPECVSLAERTAQRLWDELRVPSYLYGLAARREDRRRLEDLRRGGFEELSELLPDDVERRPDIGGPALHPTAGASAVGVRKFLIAYNVELAKADLKIAREIARRVRESSGGLPAVKALGLALGGRNHTQVSMNLTDFERTPPHAALEAIRQEARKLGVEITGAELIGLIPRKALAGAPAEFRAMFRPERILENRLEEVGFGGNEPSPPC